MLELITNSNNLPVDRSTLDELARQGAREMIRLALEAEIEEYLETARGCRDEQGRAL